MRKKKKGNSVYIEFTMIFALIAVVLVNIIGLYADHNKGLELNDIMKKYVLIMESQGCLSESERDAFILQLETIGIYNVEFDVDPTVRVGYGAEVSLAIKATTQITQMNVDGTWPVISREERVFHRQYTSIALY